MYQLFICLRYLRARKIIFFSIAGITIGIFVLIVVTSVMGGFARDMRERIRGVSSHVLVTSKYSDVYIERYEDLLAVVQSVPGVVAASPHIEWMAFIYDSAGRLRTPVGGQLIGIDPRREIGTPDQPGTSDLREYLLDGRAAAPDFLVRGLEPERPGVYGGAELVDGDPSGAETVRVATLRESLTAALPFSFHQKTFSVVGRFRTKMAEYDSGLVYMSLKSAQDLLKLGDTVTHLCVRLDDYRNAPAAVARIRERLQAIEDPVLRRAARHLRVITWEQIPGKINLLRAVEVEKAIMILILFFIIMVAGFNIIAILALIVDIKTRDIGILRALGVTSRGISGLFLWNGIIVGSLGSLIGVPLGLVGAWTLNPLEKFIGRTTGVYLFPPEIYYLDGVPSEVNYTTIFMVVVATLVTSVIFAAYPAWKAARLDPVEAIRNE